MTFQERHDTMQPIAPGTEGIYALTDPRNGRVMYIGMSKDIDRRYRQHLDVDRYETNLAKRRWLAELRALRLRPGIRILSEIGWPEMEAEEKRLVAEYRERGEAELNISDGGTCRSTSKINHTTQDDWIELGQLVRRVYCGILSIEGMTASMVGSRLRPGMNALKSAFAKYRRNLAELLSCQFPFWIDSEDVFSLEERESADQGYQPNPTAMPRVYLAGKIQSYDWRHRIFLDLADWDCDSSGKYCLPPNQNGFEYAGPFFRGRSHGVFHGDGQHGIVGYEPEDDDDHCSEMVLVRDEVPGLCKEWLRKADVVFAYFDGDEPYGSILEIGLAIGWGKPVFIAFQDAGLERLQKSTWLAQAMADKCVNAPDPISAWAQFVRWYALRVTDNTSRRDTAALRR